MTAQKQLIQKIIREPAYTSFQVFALMMVYIGGIFAFVGPVYPIKPLPSAVVCAFGGLLFLIGICFKNKEVRA